MRIITEANAFNLTLRYIDDVLSSINPHFAHWVPLIYTHELEIKETVPCATFYLSFYINDQLSSKI